MTTAEKSALHAAINRFVTSNNAPLMLRHAFHDAGSFQKSDNSGGANGSIMLAQELSRSENVRLDTAATIIQNVSFLMHRLCVENHLLCRAYCRSIISKAMQYLPVVSSSIAVLQIMIGNCFKLTGSKPVQ
jgi:hypothetical protein